MHCKVKKKKKAFIAYLRLAQGHVKSTKDKQLQENNNTQAP